MSQNAKQPLRVLVLDGGGIRGWGTLLMLGRVMWGLADGTSHQELRPCDYFRCITGAGMGGVIALLLGRLQLTVSECMGEYDDLSSNILSTDLFGPLFDIKALESEMDGVVQYYSKVKGEEVPLKDSASPTKSFIYGRRKGGDPVCIRSYDSADEEVVVNSIPEAAAAVCAAEGIFSEYTVSSPNGQDAVFLDRAFPLGLIDPTDLALEEVKKLFPDEPIETIISIGSGEVAEKDTKDLLGLACPLLSPRWLSGFLPSQVLGDEMSCFKKGRRNPKELCQALRAEHKKRCKSFPPYSYRRLQFGPVDDVGPNDFLSIEEVNNAVEAYTERLPLTSSLLLGGQSTALHWAALTGDTTVFNVLSPTDSNWDREDDQKRSPLSYAAEKGHELIITELLKSPSVDARRADVNGMTPLSYATKNGHVAVMKLLPCEEEDLNHRDLELRTPLSYAAEAGHLAAIAWLFWNHRSKLSLDMKDANGRTPLEYAEENKRERVATFLRNPSKGGLNDLGGGTT